MFIEYADDTNGVRVSRINVETVACEMSFKHSRRVGYGRAESNTKRKRDGNCEAVGMTDLLLRGRVRETRFAFVVEEILVGARRATDVQIADVAHFRMYVRRIMYRTISKSDGPLSSFVIQ